jgi:hypothetical protein
MGRCWHEAQAYERSPTHRGMIDMMPYSIEAIVAGLHRSVNVDEVWEWFHA